MTHEPQDFNPYQAPGVSDLEPPPPIGDEFLPLPWEDRARFPGFWNRVGAMFSLLFSDPLGFFDRVPRGQGFSAPWGFQLVLLAPILILIGAVFAILGTVGALANMGASPGKDAPPAWLFPLMLPLLALFLPLFLYLGMVIGGSFSHFFLWLWGGLGQGQDLGQTIRAQGYATAFINLGGMVPYLGILVQLAGFVWLGMGLARLHRTDTWRGICAMLTPFFLLCCCGILAAIAIPALIAARH